MSANGLSEAAPLRIAGLAKTGEIIASIGMALGVFVTLHSAYLAFAEPAVFDMNLRDEMFSPGDTMTVTTMIRVIVLAILMLPVAVGLYALDRARRLFRSYRLDAIFTHKAGALVKQLGWAITVLAPIWIIGHTATIAALTALNGPGQKQLAINVDDGDVFALVFGLLLIVVGRIMGEAARIAEENKAFV